MPPMERVAVVGVPMDLGANRRGVDMGPSALRYARLLEQLEDLGYTVEDLGDVPVSLARASRRRGRGLAYLEEIRAAALVLKERLAALPEGVFPIVLGGDHSLSMGSVAGAARGRRVGVVWVDAHADFNTPETSPSGNVHGMPLAVLSGLGHPRLTEVFRAVDPKDVVLVGVRSLDLVEVNPILDERNRTAEMLVGLALSLLGKRIF
mgnify:CR=1 FL=1